MQTINQMIYSRIIVQLGFTDASPLEWERVTQVPLDTNDNVNLVLLASPSFAKINDVMAGVQSCTWSIDMKTCKYGGQIGGSELMKWTCIRKAPSCTSSIPCSRTDDSDLIGASFGAAKETS